MKQLIKLAIGLAVYLSWRCIAPKRIAAAQEKLFASHSLSFLERQVLAFVLSIRQSDNRMASHYGAGSAGNRFHSHQDHRLTLQRVMSDNFYRRPMLDRFAASAARSLSQGAWIVEVGCGGGGNLLYLEQTLRDHGFHFVGFDINSDLIASNRGYGVDNVRFEVRNCFASDVTAPGDLGLISCAVFMYLREEDIESFLQRLVRNNPQRILIGLSEPVDDPNATHSSRHNYLAFAHGYRRIFRMMNFALLSESIVQEADKQSRIYHAVFEYVGVKPQA